MRNLEGAHSILDMKFPSYNMQDPQNLKTLVACYQETFW